MIKIKYYTIAKNENGEDIKYEFDASIYPNEHIIKIKKEPSTEILTALYYNGYGYNLKLYDNKNKKILIHNLESIRETPKYHFYKFELLIIGSHIISNQIFNINKAIIYFTLLSNFKLVNNIPLLKYRIENNIDIQITNSQIILSKINLSENQIINIVTNIFEIISIICGHFPIVTYFDFFTANHSIKKYCKQRNYLITSAFDISNNKNLLASLNELDFCKTYELYKKTKLEVSNLPIQSFFIAQSNSHYYIDFKLVTMLQSLEGFYSKFYVKKIKSNNSIDPNKAVITPLKKFLKKYQKKLQCTDILKSKICNTLSYINKIDLRNYLEYILKKEYAQIIFDDEIKSKKESKYILPINDFISASINERNKLSHMNINSQKKYFTNSQSTVAYNKLKLLYRCSILEILDISIDKKLLLNSVNFIKNTYQ